MIGQADYHLSDKAKIETGVWRYAVPLSDVSGGTLRRPDEGAHASIEGPLPGSDTLSAWARVGFANGHAQTVSGYLGGGIVAQGLVDGRPQDRLGLAIARAEIGLPSRRNMGLSPTETSLELSYQVKIRNTFAVQPDAQYILHPASAAHIRSALAVGLRIVLTAGYPKKAPAAEATDPTVPPDGPQPPDSGTTGPPKPTAS